MANAAILGTGRAYPKGVLTNADLEQMVETSDEWITTRTGIKERHRAAADEYTSMFAVAASRKAIETRGSTPRTSTSSSAPRSRPTRFCPRRAA